jgi:hypothetical protein
VLLIQLRDYRALASRRWSIKMQRSITTSRPASCARRAASSWITPSCIHTTFAPLRMAASTISGTCSERRKMSTMSIGIEERVWETLQRKKSLFAGVFDSPQAEVSFAALGRKSGLEAMKEVIADRPQPEKPKPVIAPAPPARVETPPDNLGKAAGGLLEAGLKFLESMTSDRPLDQVLSGLISRAPGTNRPVPLPESITEGRLTSALAGLLSRLR